MEDDPAKSATPPPQEEKPDASAAFLSAITGNSVIVKLNSGLEYHGTLQSVDGFMNIALEATKEYVDTKLTNDYGDVFIRGNNGKCFSDFASFFKKEDSHLYELTETNAPLQYCTFQQYKTVINY